MSQNHVIELPNTPKLRPVFCDYAGGRFRLTAEGLTFVGIDKDGNSLPSRWICALLYAVAKTRDAQSGEWGRLLEWQDDDGVTHQWAMPLALLQGDASDVRRELAPQDCMFLPVKFGEVNKLPIPSVFTLSTEGANKTREVWQPARWLANFTCNVG